MSVRPISSTAPRIYQTGRRIGPTIGCHSLTLLPPHLGNTVPLDSIPEGNPTETVLIDNYLAYIVLLGNLKDTVLIGNLQGTVLIGSPMGIVLLGSIKGIAYIGLDSPTDTVPLGTPKGIA